MRAAGGAAAGRARGDAPEHRQILLLNTAAITYFGGSLSLLPPSPEPPRLPLQRPPPSPPPNPPVRSGGYLEVLAPVLPLLLLLLPDAVQPVRALTLYRVAPLSFTCGVSGASAVPLQCRVISTLGQLLFLIRDLRRQAEAVQALVVTPAARAKLQPWRAGSRRISRTLPTIIASPMLGSYIVFAFFFPIWLISETSLKIF